MQYVNKYQSPLGAMTMASNGEALTGLWFDGQKYFAAALEKEYRERNITVFELTKKWLDMYFKGENPDFTPPLSLAGSSFRMMVWDALLKIPYGKTMTYGEIAGQIAVCRGAKRISAQAVGGAVGHNPISIIVPCHRVVGSTGSLTGYAGGINRKIALLQIEKTDMSKLFAPRY